MCVCVYFELWDIKMSACVARILRLTSTLLRFQFTNEVFRSRLYVGIVAVARSNRVSVASGI